MEMTGVERKTALITTRGLPVLQFLIKLSQVRPCLEEDIWAEWEAACWTAVSPWQPFQLSLRPLLSGGRQELYEMYSPGVHVLGRALTLILIEEQSLNRAENQRGLRDGMLSPSQNHSFTPSSKKKIKIKAALTTAPLRTNNVSCKALFYRLI